mmetsp:Transcript_26116/g.60655  ORF Transcript_26116/g.60655 Transcript_26116/m.60655 type:complete len:123 (-) Transcript_26116:845-1213(-)
MQHASGCEEKPSGLPSCGRHPERLYEIQKIGGNIHGKTNTGPVAKTPTQDVKERTKKRVTHEISVGENKVCTSQYNTISERKKERKVYLRLQMHSLLSFGRVQMLGLGHFSFAKEKTTEQLI